MLYLYQESLSTAGKELLIMQEYNLQTFSYDAQRNEMENILINISIFLLFTMILFLL